MSGNARERVATREGGDWSYLLNENGDVIGRIISSDGGTWVENAAFAAAGWNLLVTLEEWDAVAFLEASASLLQQKGATASANDMRELRDIIRSALHRSMRGFAQGVTYTCSDIALAYICGARQARECGRSPSDVLIDRAADAYVKSVHPLEDEPEHEDGGARWRTFAALAGDYAQAYEASRGLPVGSPEAERVRRTFQRLWDFWTSLSPSTPSGSTE